MEVYEFDKCLLDRLEESMNVLSWKGEVIPASQVRVEWSYFIELQIEPAGWQALWKIPRVICEELQLRYPTVVFGFIEQVLFKELKAVFVVQAVQDEDVHLPERHEVALEDLWPTRVQENEELNVERTADCLDRLRFFYTNVWMPWDNDNDDDLNWVEKHLESRIRFCYDLRKRSMKRALAAHIRTLLTEAKYIQQRREYLELGLSDDDDEADDTMNKSQVTDLMRLHLRLAIIRSEIEMLENPEMRRIYEEIKFDDEKFLKDTKNVINAQGQRLKIKECNNYIVMLPCTLERQIELLHIAQERMLQNVLVQIFPTLQDVLSVCDASDNIFLSPGRHNIKFLEYLNTKGCISGLLAKINHAAASNPDSPENVVIASPDDDSILLVFDGDFALENLMLDCRNIRTGILVKNGTIVLRNCHLIGDGKSSTQQGIVCAGSAELVLEHCSLEHFATAVSLGANTSLRLTNANITNCKIGLDVGAMDAKVTLKHANIVGALKCGIYASCELINDSARKYITLRDLNELEKCVRMKIPLAGDCNFKNCKANIYILNEGKSLFAAQSLKYLMDENKAIDYRSVSPCTDVDNNLEKSDE